jgi:hypothetical protein
VDTVAVHRKDHQTAEIVVAMIADQIVVSAASVHSTDQPIAQAKDLLTVEIQTVQHAQALAALLTAVNAHLKDHQIVLHHRLAVGIAHQMINLKPAVLQASQKHLFAAHVAKTN